MSSSTIIEAIENASQKYTLSVYFIIIIGGIIGNICNIMVFGCLKVFQRNQCAFYLIVESIVNIFLLIIALPLRVAEYAFNYDLTLVSLAWCKIRQTIIPVLLLISFSSICFAAIDQYLSTHYHPWLRQLSTLKLAHRLVYSAIFFSSLHGIPFLIFFEIQSTLGCAIYNKGFSYYYSFVFFCVLIGILPITVSAFFAILAYLNVRRIIRHQVPVVRRRLDRQLTAMVLTKVAFLVVTTLPFVIFRIYDLNRSIDLNNFVRIAIENLIFGITLSLFYVNSAGTFYIFLLVSKRFRQQVKRILVKNIWKKLLFLTLHNHNQVVPVSHNVDLDLE